MRRKLDKLVVIRGAGEVGTGVACRLFRCNFRVVLLELPQPRTVMRQVAFAEAVYEGKATIEGVPTIHCATAHEARFIAERGEVIPLLVDPEAHSTPAFSPVALIDARMVGNSDGTNVEDAPLVIGLGPGFRCGIDVHRAIETCDGPGMGRVIMEGEAASDPEAACEDRGPLSPASVVAPAAGMVEHTKSIGDLVEPNEVLCTIDGVEARSRVGGLVTGLIRDGIQVEEGWKVAKVDPLGREADPAKLGCRPLAISGGVLEAMLSSLSVRVRV